MKRAGFSQKAIADELMRVPRISVEVIQIVVDSFFPLS
jgi:hypothetical protein